MKKIVLLTLAALLILPQLSSCKKEKKDSQKPTISWEANGNFATSEITADLDGKILIQAAEGIDRLQIEASVPATLIIAINEYIGISANKASLKSETAVLDILEDTTVSNELYALGVTSLRGANIKGKTETTIDLAKLVHAITDKNMEVIGNGTSLKFKIIVRDTEDNDASRTAIFNWTSAPEISINPADRTVQLASGKPACTVTVKAEGKISALTLTPNGDKGINDFIASKTKAGDAVIDLINDDKITHDAYGFAFPSRIANQKTATIKLDNLLFQLNDVAQSRESSLLVRVTDANGKTAESEIKLVKSSE